MKKIISIMLIGVMTVGCEQTAGMVSLQKAPTVNEVPIAEKGHIDIRR
jgi:PBP1b-binding outer membrane lipoprotein LpoB